MKAIRPATQTVSVELAFVRDMRYGLLRCFLVLRDGSPPDEIGSIPLDVGPEELEAWRVSRYAMVEAVILDMAEEQDIQDVRIVRRRHPVSMAS